MFRRGEIVNGPFPAIQADRNIGAHYLVVLDSNQEGALVMFVTSLKEATGGAFEFTVEERTAAKLVKPSRFDPTRIALFRTCDLNKLSPTGGCLSRRSVEKLILAGARAKAAYVTFRAELRIAA